MRRTRSLCLFSKMPDYLSKHVCVCVWVIRTYALHILKGIHEYFKIWIIYIYCDQNIVNSINFIVIELPVFILILKVYVLVSLVISGFFLLLCHLIIFFLQPNHLDLIQVLFKEKHFHDEWIAYYKRHMCFHIESCITKYKAGKQDILTQLFEV